MKLLDIILLIAKFLHAISAAVWLGGSFILLLSRKQISQSSTDLGIIFKDTVNASIILLVSTGIVLSLDRITTAKPSNIYLILLGFKVALSFWLFFLVWKFRSNKYLNIVNTNKMYSWIFSYTFFVISGISIFMIAEILSLIVEKNL